jgi:DNA-directed RNA polymerase V subunit 1
MSFVLSKKDRGEALQFLDVLQPVLMESLLLEGFSVSLKNFNVTKAILEKAWIIFQKQSIISESLFLEMRIDNKQKCQNNSIYFCIQLFIYM